MITKKASLLATTALAVLALACSGPADRSSSHEPTAGSQTSAGDVSDSIASVLKSYEAIRAKLAADQAPQRSHYEELATEARQAAHEQSGQGQQALVDLSEAAQEAAVRATQELAEARRQFGEISAPLIGFLSAKPELARGRFVFECPMAKGYPKWVQAAETASNPYMGTQMASCGTASDWAR